MKLLVLFVAFSLAVCVHAAALTQQTDVSSLCLKCLCEGSTSGCDHGAQCDSYGFCGPFRISENYWRDAGSFENDFKKCANNFDCAEKTVKAYMQKYGKDCDGDGDVDCLDYALIHHKGHNGCPYQDYSSDSLYKYVDTCIARAPQDAQVLRQDVAQSMKNTERDQQNTDLPSSGSQIGSDVGQNIKAGGEQLKKNVEDQAENLQDKGRNIGEKVTGSLKNAKDSVQGKFKDAKDTVKDTFQSGKEGLQDKAHQMTSALSGQTEQLKDKTSDMAHDVKHQGEHLQDKGSDMAHDAKHQGERLQDKLHSDQKDEMMQGKDKDMHSSSGASPLPEMIRHRRAALVH